MPFHRGSALRALCAGESDSVTALLAELDRVHLPCDAYGSAKEQQVPFVLCVQTVHNVKGVGVALIGKARQGTLSTGDSVELLGGAVLPSTSKRKLPKQGAIEASVASLKLFDHSVKTGHRRDYLGVALHGSLVSAKTVKRGMCLVKQLQPRGAEGRLAAYWKFEADIDFFAEEESDGFIGKATPMQCGFQPVFHFATNDTSGTIEALPSEQNGVIMPGDKVEGVTVCLQQSNVLWEGFKFIVREAGRTIGAGVVTKTIDL